MRAANGNGLREGEEKLAFVCEPGQPGGVTTKRFRKLRPIQHWCPLSPFESMVPSVHDEVIGEVAAAGPPRSSRREECTEPTEGRALGRRNLQPEATHKAPPCQSPSHPPRRNPPPRRLPGSRVASAALRARPGTLRPVRRVRKVWSISRCVIRTPRAST